jgi:hypothetical protein
VKEFEPSMNSIDDYNGKESPEKRNTVIKVIGILLVLGTFYSIAYNTLDNVEDKIPGAVNLALEKCKF